MASPSGYDSVARAYADGVRSLLAPVAPSAAERATPAPASTDALTAQATALARRSAELRQATTADLSRGGRGRARQSLDTATGPSRHRSADQRLSPAGGARRRNRANGAHSRGRFLAFRYRGELGDPDRGRSRPSRTRAVVLPPDLRVGPRPALGLVVTTLNTIESRAAKTGQTAVSGLLVLGIGQVAHVAGIVGLDIAQTIGVADKVTRLYALVRDYALSAYNALVALLGPTIAQSTAQQVVAWVNDVAAGEQFRKLLAQFYETKRTANHLDYGGDGEPGRSQQVRDRHPGRGRAGNRLPAAARSRR